MKVSVFTVIYGLYLVILHAVGVMRDETPNIIADVVLVAFAIGALYLNDIQDQRDERAQQRRHERAR